MERSDSSLQHYSIFALVLDPLCRDFELSTGNGLVEPSQRGLHPLIIEEFLGNGRTRRSTSLVIFLAAVASAVHTGYLRIEISRVVVRGFFQVDVPLYQVS